MTSKKNKINIIKGASRPFEAEGYLEVGVKQPGRRDCEKLYFKPMTSKWQ